MSHAVQFIHVCGRGKADDGQAACLISFAWAKGWGCWHTPPHLKPILMDDYECDPLWTIMSAIPCGRLRARSFKDDYE